MKNFAFRLIALLFISLGATAQQAPVIKVNGSKTGPWSFHFEAGTTICINFSAYENETSPGDTTIIEWNKGISSATFSNTNSDSLALVQNDEAVFCWTPSGKYGCKTHYFMVYARYKNKPEIRPSQVVISLTIWTHPTFTDHIISKGNGTYVFVPQILDGCGIINKDTTRTQYYWSIPTKPTSRLQMGANQFIWYDSVRILTHTFPQNGTYYYKQWIWEPFKGSHNVFRIDSIQVTDVLETGIQNLENKFTIYPNPAKELVYVNTTAQLEKLWLTDLTGRSFELLYTHEGQSYVVALPVGITSGVYFIRAASGSHAFVRKLYVQ